MGSDVLVNGMEPCCIASDGKCIAAMPDVCFTPPQAPPTPPGVPIPYPNNGMASDLTDGTTSVQICGKPVAMKDKSSFKKTAGDEAGNAGTKGVVSASNRGALFFAAWSMDVKFEGENVVRHLDIGTANHASEVGNCPPWPFLASQRPTGPIEEEKCRLRTYDEGCDNGETPHHCVPDHCFREPGRGGARYDGAPSHGNGLCVCVKGSSKSKGKSGKSISGKNYRSAEKHYKALADHGRIHMVFDAMEAALGAEGIPENSATLGDLETAAAEAVGVVTGCDPQHLKDQLRTHHANNGLPEESRWRADPHGRLEEPDFDLLGSAIDVGDP